MSTSVRAYRELKKQIQKKNGGITKIAHCRFLSDNIFIQTGERISESTLFRIFTDNQSHTPYEYTLDVLCRYIGYENWRSFESKQTVVITTEENNLHLSLLQICLENNNIESVVRFLKTLPDDYSMGFRAIGNISHVIGEAIRENEHLQSTLIPELATFEQGRIYFTETFVDKKHFDEYFRKNLKLYLKTQVKNPIKRLDDNLFALNLLFLNSLQKNNKSAVYSYSKLLKSYETHSLIRQEKNHPTPLFRYNLFLLVQRYLSRKISPAFFVNAIFRLHEEFGKREPGLKALYMQIACDFLIYFRFYSEAKQLFESITEEQMMFHLYNEVYRKEMDLLKLKLTTE